MREPLNDNEARLTLCKREADDRRVFCEQRSSLHPLFREQQGRIAVFSILRENMDMLRRLREDDGLPKE